MRPRPAVQDPQRPVAGGDHVGRVEVVEAGGQVDHRRGRLDARHLVERVEPTIDPALQRRELLIGDADARGSRHRRVRVRQQLDRALRIPVHQVRAVDAILHGTHQLHRLGNRLAGDAGARDGVRRARGGEPGHGGPDGEDAGHHDHAGQPEAAAPALLPLRRAGDAAGILRTPSGHEGQDPGDQGEHTATERRLGAFGGVSGAMKAASDGVGQRDRALIGQPGEWLRRAHRLEVVGRGGRGEVGHLHRQDPVGSGASTDGEDLLKVLDRLAGSHRGQGRLELVDADGVREVPADQCDAVVGRQGTLPRVRLDLEGLAEGRRHSPPADPWVLLGHGRWGWDLVHSAVAHDDGARRTELGDVRLPGPDDDGDDADAGAARDPEPLAAVVETPVGAGQRTAQRHQDAGRQVVVVVTLDGVEGDARRLGQRRAPARELGEQVEAPLRTGGRTHGRLVEGNEVECVRRPLLGGRQSDPGCEAVAHGGPGAGGWMLGRL